MAASGGESESASFEVSSDPSTAVPGPVFEGANVCRVAALSTLLGGDLDVSRDLATELSELGFSEQVIVAERGLAREPEPFETLASLQHVEATGDRIGAWEALNGSAQPREAVTFLVAVLGSELERESTAAAAALWRHIATIDPSFGYIHPAAWLDLTTALQVAWPDGRLGYPWLLGPLEAEGDVDDADLRPWNPDAWAGVYRRVIRALDRGDPYTNAFVIGFLSRWRLDQALHSRDPVTRSLASAAFLSPPGRNDGGWPPKISGASSVNLATVLSTMIHGTAAWMGDWWEPGGDFHGFIHASYRPNLYSEGAPFSWSGKYRKSHRERAAERFGTWAGTMARDGGLETVFAHSYGGDVAAIATLGGTPVEEIVLLSAPVTRHITDVANTGMRITDIRLRFDPILALARKPQRLNGYPNVTTVLLNRWRLDHSASRRQGVWEDEQVAERGNLAPT